MTNPIVIAWDGHGRATPPFRFTGTLGGRPKPFDATQDRALVLAAVADEGIALQWPGC